MRLEETRLLTYSILIFFFSYMGGPNLANWIFTLTDS